MLGTLPEPRNAVSVALRAIFAEAGDEGEIRCPGRLRNQRRPPSDPGFMARSTASMALSKALASLRWGRSDRSINLPLRRIAHWNCSPLGRGVTSMV